MHTKETVEVRAIKVGKQRLMRQKGLKQLGIQKISLKSKILTFGPDEALENGED